MTWFKVDDRFYDHPKVRRLGKDRAAAIGVWTLCGSWAADKETDGFVPAEVAQRYDPRERMAARLVAVGLWHQDTVEGETGYRFHDWHIYQPSAEKAQAKRKVRQEAGRRGGIKSGQTRRSKTEANASAKPEANHEAKTNPEPEPIEAHLPAQGTTTATHAHEREHGETPTGPGITGPRSADALRLVDRTIGPNFPAETRTALARETSTLLGQYEPELVAQALEAWKTRTGIGPRILPSLVADLVKTANGVPERSERVRSSPSRAPHGASTGSKRVDKALGFLDQVEMVKAELAAEQSRKLLEGGVSA
ncbi:hypothetical protein JOF56_011647 [Kibdelosporangium banguiense]|uniref:Helix-turn-helix domain-containing protein n=1 Tax=Kibdelosporangium banguiense TaxID=1365924 RepID=A0ABS4U3L9_9PSEU|nr:hypothetical protein [Kibdelosporangium banguiense]MBP2331262.1 hypothetical protein [Kibdelosporangium banguiense]